MPAQRLTATGCTVAPFDVIGCFVLPDETVIRHIGLAAESHTALTANASADLYHMQPPLDLTPHSAHFVASAALSADEYEDIEDFIAEHQMRSKAEALRQLDSTIILPAPRDEYIICPGFLEKSDDVPYRRDNCVGFVCTAYHRAGIDILDEAKLPAVDEAQITAIYPAARTIFRRKTFMKDQGLNGTGPWPVAFPGYVMASLNRPHTEIRAQGHVPAASEIHFMPA